MSRHTFSVGDEVIIFGKADVGSAKIKALLDMADGALLLDAPLANLRYWNESEMALADNPERIAGPYYIMHTRKDDITVCGRYGKIIARYGPTQEAKADAHRNRLAKTYVGEAPKPIRMARLKRDVLHRASMGYIEYNAPKLGGIFEEFVACGWLEAKPYDNRLGYFLTLTPAGAEVFDRVELS